MIKTILNKLYKRSTDVKPRLVKLATVQEIRSNFEESKRSSIQNLETAITNVSFAKEAVAALKSELEYIEYGELDDLYDKINDLGIPAPEELNTLNEEMRNLEFEGSEIDTLSSKLDGIENELSSLYNQIT